MQTVERCSPLRLRGMIGSRGVCSNEAVSAAIEADLGATLIESGVTDFG